MSRLLKGSAFLNRYRISGTLKTLSPMHIGTGEECASRLKQAKNVEKKPPAKKEANFADSITAFMGIADDDVKKKEDETHKVSTVIKDHAGRPMIPGSSLRGVMRHWLLDVLRGVSADWASVRDYEGNELTSLGQDAQIEKVLAEFSLLELVFGTPFNAGKVEIWDATCTTPAMEVTNSLLHWDAQSLTYVDTSVAIDPDTGTALENLLYQTEVVPPGVCFEFNLVGQNLSDVELGLVLLALQGFNSAIYPVRIGARSGRGYGRVEFTPGDIYCLEEANMRAWIADSMNGLPFGGATADAHSEGGNAGYFALPKLDAARQRALIADVKAKVRAGLGEV